MDFEFIHCSLLIECALGVEVKILFWGFFAERKIATKNPPRQLAGNAHQKRGQAQDIL